MPNEQTGKSTLGALRLQYLGGDDDWYSGTSATISSPITVSGAFAAILKFANENNLSIVPEAQNMTKYDGSGIATVTLSADGGGSDFVGVTGTITFQNNSQYTMDIELNAVQMGGDDNPPYPRALTANSGASANSTETLNVGTDFEGPLVVGSVLELVGVGNITYSNITNLEALSDTGMYKVLGEFAITITQS